LLERVGEVAAGIRQRNYLWLRGLGLQKEGSRAFFQGGDDQKVVNFEQKRRTLRRDATARLGATVLVSACGQ
jgi:hypothetical protein